MVKALILLASLVLVTPTAALNILEAPGPATAAEGLGSVRVHYNLTFQAERDAHAYVKVIPIPNNAAHTWSTSLRLVEGSRTLASTHIGPSGIAELGPLAAGATYTLTAILEGATNTTTAGTMLQFTYALAQRGTCGEGSSGGCLDPSVTLAYTLEVVAGTTKAPVPWFFGLVALAIAGFRRYR